MDKDNSDKVNGKAGGINKGMEKEDLWGQKGHPRETSNKTQGGELLPSVGAPLSINPGRAKDQTQVRT